MIVSLFIDADTCYRFTKRADAFIYAGKHDIENYCVLTEYAEESDLKASYKFSVYNTYLSGAAKIEYFHTETSALMYIGSFLN